ncbi:flagellar export chaperone FliS [Aminithiophilus ramosus]|uniref:Flagellar export chaperone FliS n=2 Tax=Synergistales TaxID=649776 RepID=A0A9Q7EW03_9BACT|nr:flagellar export chaperone FliS [Aminithiophilus ramosus]QTX31300.1 flagellar export chaperone FliS [Aminithiophilus ramosus]QVL35101.1 flagellar export chaperone FliS [Synergistota bacterium]
MEERLSAQDNRRSRAQETYRINQVQTASREQLLLLTYDIGIRACFSAERAMEENDAERVNDELKRGQAVIRELMVTLRPEVAGEVGVSLMALYEFMHGQLVEANVARDRDKIVVVRQMLEELRSTWQEAIAALQAQQRASEAQPQMQAGGLNFAG